MEIRFNLDSCTTLVISDSTIADPRPGYAHGNRAPDEVAVQIVHVPLGSNDGVPDYVNNISLRCSEARTIASALMTAAQRVR